MNFGKENNGCTRIVVTGGPGGGKTTAAELLRREIGERIVVVPEAATLLYRGGFPRSKEVGAALITQREIYHLQRSLEDIHKKLYPNRVLLCDRGTLDGSAYWPSCETNYFEYLGTNTAAEYSRYDTVLFFETAAVGKISIEGGNPVRNESLDEAVALDKRLREAWENHPHYIFVPHQKSFLDKINFAIDKLREVIDMRKP